MPELSYREAVRDALARAMREDDGVFVMGEDIAEMGGSMGVTQGMLNEFGPDRVRNTPISEMAIVGAGSCAAMQGMRPVVEVMYEDFLTLSLEQIVNQAAKHRYMSGGQLEVPEELEPIEIGKARVHREGEDVTVVATGRLVYESLAAAQEAEKEGVSVEVVDPRTLQPLDEQTIVDSVKKTNRCVTAHEAVTRMGFGAEVAAVVQHQAFDWLDAPIERVGARFVPLPFAPVMEQYVVPHAEDVLEAIMRTVARAA